MLAPIWKSIFLKVSNKLCKIIDTVSVDKTITPKKTVLEIPFFPFHPLQPILTDFSEGNSI